MALLEGPKLPGASPLLGLAVVLVLGVVAGYLAKRVRMPSTTGQILVGILIGHSALNLFGESTVESLQPLTHFALGLVAVTTGAHLQIGRMRNAGKRLVLLLLAEVTITPLLVFAGVRFLPLVTGGLALLFAAVAVETAPATVVALVKETRSKGVFVKTLIGAVAFNNVACIFLFEVARTVAAAEIGETDGTIWIAIQSAGIGLGKAALLGSVAALGMEAFTRYLGRADRVASAGVATILLTSGTADFFGISPLLACLVLGIVQTNINPSRDQVVDRVFTNFEPAILAVFFTLAGMHLSFDRIGQAGLVALIFFALRASGKLLAVRWAMKAAGATEALRKHLGLALLPQAGLTIGLLVLIQDDTRFAPRQDLVDFFVAAVLAAVTLNEIVGPIATRLAIGRAGEAGKDRSRLIDFLQEENIVTGMRARSKQEAIEQLVDLLVSTHDLRAADREPILRSVLERENQVSTCLGGGLAVPHGILEGRTKMLGVMGLSSDGLAFPTPDGKAVHCMVLLVTPPEERNRHLQVLAALARIVGQNEAVREQLFHAQSAAHAWELLHGEETEGFNYFLDEGPLTADPARSA